jgi:hypothetical protein
MMEMSLGLAGVISQFFEFKVVVIIIFNRLWALF